jgi:hypothetical protein
MENGEYYLGVGATTDPNCPRLVLGYKLAGKRVEIYKNQESYIVVNTKTEKFLTCLNWKHAHFVFEECVRTLSPIGWA